MQLSDVYCVAVSAAQPPVLDTRRVSVFLLPAFLPSSSCLPYSFLFSLASVDIHFSALKYSSQSSIFDVSHLYAASLRIRSALEYSQSIVLTSWRTTDSTPFHSLQIKTRYLLSQIKSTPCGCCICRRHNSGCLACQHRSSLASYKQPFLSRSITNVRDLHNSLFCILAHGFQNQSRTPQVPPYMEL